MKKTQTVRSLEPVLSNLRGKLFNVPVFLIFYHRLKTEPEKPFTFLQTSISILFSTTNIYFQHVIRRFYEVKFHGVRCLTVMTPSSHQVSKL